MLAATSLSNDRIREIAYYLYLASRTHDHPSEVEDYLRHEAEFADNRIQEVRLLQTPQLFHETGGHTYCGLAAATPSDVVIALRGTRFQNPDELLLDLLALPDESGIHIGFNLYGRYIWQQIAEFLANHGNADKRLTIAGHSLGAAAATLVTYQLNYSGLNDETALNTYVFGHPAMSLRPLALTTPLFTFSNSIDPVPFVLQEIAPSILIEYLLPAVRWIQSDVLPFLPLDLIISGLNSTASTLAQYHHATSRLLAAHVIGDYGIHKRPDLDDLTFSELQSVDYSDALLKDVLLHQDLGRLFTEVTTGDFRRLLGVALSALYGRFLYKHQMKVYAKSLQLPVDD
jgi:pimeloyl-ACP methyl ester carboxylesterase